MKDVWFLYFKSLMFNKCTSHLAVGGNVAQRLLGLNPLSGSARFPERYSLGDMEILNHLFCGRECDCLSMC